MKPPCLYPLPSGRRCCECDNCQDTRSGDGEEPGVCASSHSAPSPGASHAAYLYVHEVICAGCKKPWTAGHVCPTPPRPWWKR